MKTKLSIIFLAIAGLLLSSNFAFSQCSGGTLAGTISVTTTYQTIPCIMGGQYYNFAATAGTSYTFTFCTGGGSASYDTQLTILNNAGAYAGGYSDDACGTASEVVWTAPSTGTFRILNNNYSCITGTTCAVLAYRQNPPLGPGSTCLNPIVIPSLPFTQTGRTTCGFGDDYSSVDACGSSYMNGDDIVFAYTSAGNEEISINLTNTGTWMGVFVMNGCPNVVGTTCMPLSSGGSGNCSGSGSATNTNSAGNPYGTWELCNAGTYYIVISTFPSPQCGAFDISITRTASTCGSGSSGTFCYTTASSPYTPHSYTTGTTVTFDDDEFSTVSFPIGFNFCYAGVTYSQFVISSNGYISFNPTCVNQYSPYVTVALPNTAETEVANGVLLTWQDIDPDPLVRTDYIRYNVYGTSPNRRLAVSFDRVPYYGSLCSSNIYRGQLVLEETSNNIYMYIAQKPFCVDWNNGNAVQGITNIDGSQALIVAGRNNTNWTATNEGRVFSPSCPMCLIVLPVRYSSFTARRIDDRNALNWTTSEESSLNYFEVQRSTDGRNFSPIGNVSAKGSQGAGSNYDFIDNKVTSPISYYRLREINLNGDESFSEIVTVIANGVTFEVEQVLFDQISNTVEVNVNVISQRQMLKAEIHDLAGRKVYSNNFWLNQGNQEIRIDANGIASGYYLLSLYDNANQRITKRFVKQ